MKVILETERLFLREYVEEDAEAFFRLNSDPEVLRFVPDKGLLNVEQARQILVDHPIADYGNTALAVALASSRAPANRSALRG
jgi:Acetyltransferases, including N-acetylases of ribosomal proteins